MRACSISSIVVALLLVGATHLSATEWLVGPARNHTAPSQVSSLVRDGDTVSIDAGVYAEDVARWSANRLVLRGVGGQAHLNANGKSYGGKAIWVIAGDSALVENIEFSQCRVVDRNGAGIRQEGTSVTIRSCYFHDNETGILSGNDSASDIIIEYSEFAHNGSGDGYSHNLYINHVRSLVFRFNFSHRAVIGHELKSRAYRNEICYNRLSNESDGRASREIDLPNGGIAIILGNEIVQGPLSENSGIIGYGLEGLSNPGPHRIVLASNTLINLKATGNFIAVQSGTEVLRCVNTMFAGPGSVVVGTPNLLDTAANLVTSLGGAGLVDIAMGDYRPTEESPAKDRGIDAGEESGVDLNAAFEYVHPWSSAPRMKSGPIDIGAHEASPVSRIDRMDGARRLDLSASGRHRKPGMVRMAATCPRP